MSVPEGFHEEWVEAPAEWRLATRDERGDRRCRHSTRRQCLRIVTVALNRGRWESRLEPPRRVDAWWFYCEEHAYGRKVVGARILQLRLVRDEALA